MSKLLWRTALLALAAATAPVALSAPRAQNPAQIASTRAGRSCPACNLFQGDFSQARFRALNLRGARLRQASFSASVVRGGDFSHADLRDVDAYGGLFTNVSFRDADLTNATFVGAVFAGGDLTGAKLTGMNLSGAELRHVRGLTARQLAAACGDDTTILPAGLRVSRCR